MKTSFFVAGTIDAVRLRCAATIITAITSARAYIYKLPHRYRAN